MTGVASAIAGGAIIGGVVSSSNASKAASAQQNAANQADQTQLQMFNTSNAEQAPWRTAGGQAVNALSQWYGLGGVNIGGSGAGTTATPGAATTPNFGQIISQTPGYQFQMQQGDQAVQRSLASQGLLQSGAAGKALQTFGQGLAGQYANQYVGGLQSLAGVGQSSVQATGQLGQATANQIGSNQIYAGNAQATGYANQSQAINNAVGGVGYGLAYMNSPYGYYANQQQVNSFVGANPVPQAPSGGFGLPGSAYNFNQSGMGVNPFGSPESP